MQTELAKAIDRCLTAEELSQKIKLHPTIISYTHDFPGYFTPHEVNRAAIRMANSPEPTVVFKDNKICLES
jgi:hypothetical protein